MTTYFNFNSFELPYFVYLSEKPRDIFEFHKTRQDNYFSVCIYPDKLSGKESLLDVVSSKDGTVVLQLYAEKQDVLCLRHLKTHAACTCHLSKKSTEIFFAIRFGSSCFGLSTGLDVYECNELVSNPDNSIKVVLNSKSDAIRFTNFEDNIAETRSALFYKNSSIRPKFNVEAVYYWANQYSGIPLHSIQLFETVTARGNVRILPRWEFFSVYPGSEKVYAQDDFYKMFSMQNSIKSDSDILLHFVPPQYSVPDPQRYNIGFFSYEAEKIHPGIIDRINKMDEVVVFTPFVQKSFKQNGVTVPVNIIQPGVNAHFFTPNKITNFSKIKAKSDEFTFFCCCSCQNRKNWQFVLESYMKEFNKQENVSLLLILQGEYMYSSRQVYGKFYQTYIKFAKINSPKVIISTDKVSSASLYDILSTVDCYVLPSQEGVGLTHMEAMSMGLPVIGLNYGGVTAFLNETNGYPVNPDGFYKENDFCYMPLYGMPIRRPNMKSLTTTMRQVYKNSEKTKTNNARRDMTEKYKWENAAEQLETLLLNVEGRLYKNKKKNKKDEKLSNITWCIVEKENNGGIVQTVKKVRKIYKNAEVICLLNDGVKKKDILYLVNKNVLLHYGGETEKSINSFLTISATGTWAILLYSGEKVIVNDCARLCKFLSELDSNITAVWVETIKKDVSEYQNRIIRILSPIKYTPQQLQLFNVEQKTVKQNRILTDAIKISA